jgi:hypothetical protein
MFSRSDAQGPRGFGAELAEQGQFVVDFLESGNGVDRRRRGAVRSGCVSREAQARLEQYGPNVPDSLWTGQVPFAYGASGVFTTLSTATK